MTEWIISSSVLILIIICLRRMLRGKLSLRLQYALWGLVLLRLLLPFSLFDSGISVMNAVDDISSVKISQTAEDISALEDIAFVPNYSVTPSDGVEAISGSGRIEGYYSGDSDHSYPTVILPESSTEEFQLLEKAIKAQDILIPAWLTGAVVMLCVFFISNLRFGRTLRRSRQELDIPGSIIPVYVSAAAETPCLFGFFRPSIYVTPDSAEDARTLRHVLVHENTHYRHGDNVWSLLRCLAIALHWYNPLVWWAAVLSKRDAELACDEGVLSHLGDGERGDYGRTLIGLTCSHGDFSSLALTATTMTGSKNSIKERITLIAKKPQMGVIAFWSVILVAILAVGCTFTGAKNSLSDNDFITMAYEDAQSTAFVNGVSISESGVLTREGDSSGKFVVIRFPVIEPVEKSADQIKVTYTMHDENGNATKEPYNAVIEYVDADADTETAEFDSYNDVKIAAIIDDKIPTYAIEAARRYVFEQAEVYMNRHEKISGAKLTGLTAMPTDIGKEDFDVQMYLVEYRLVPENPDDIILVGGETMEDGCITEWGSTGQPYMMVVTGEDGVFSGLCMYTNTDALETDYSTPGMLAKYGSKYTAACMESYYDLISEENYSYYVMMQTGGVGIPPYYHLKYERVYTENGWLNADGKAINIMDITVPTVSIGDYPGSLVGYVELDFHCNPLIIRGPMNIYRENFEIVSIDDMSFYEAEDLYALEPGNYYVTFDITVPGRYIAEEDMREETGYTCVFRLEVTPNVKDVFYFTGDSESLVELYAREIHAKEMLSVEGDYAITDYKLLDCEVYAERVDGGAVVGLMHYAIAPVNWELPDWWAGAGMEEGEGEYEGMWIRHNQFTLVYRGNGYWECTGLSTGGAGGWGYYPSSLSDEEITELIVSAMDEKSDVGFLQLLPVAKTKLIPAERLPVDFFDMLTSSAIGDDQLIRNLYIMKGCLLSDGALAEHYANTLLSLHEHDEETFNEALELLPEDEREEVEMHLAYAMSYYE